MSESCNVVINNKSGRPLDAILLWHTSDEPTPPDWTPDQAVIRLANMATGATAGGTASLSWGSPTDYWSLAVLFHGDGTTYLMAGSTAQGFKEYEVSDGSTITFTINAYTSGTTDQNDILIAYSGDQGGSARLLNPWSVAIFGTIGGAMTEAAKHVVAEAVV